jgi:hypothetical protein
MTLLLLIFTARATNQETSNAVTRNEQQNDENTNLFGESIKLILQKNPHPSPPMTKHVFDVCRPDTTS